jgi:hypothetical protein
MRSKHWAVFTALCPRIKQQLTGVPYA